MKYKLELHTKDSFSNIVFNNIIFDSFKINIIERYIGRVNYYEKLSKVVIKVRTLDDQIIRKNDGNIKLRILNKELKSYKQITKQLNTSVIKGKSADIKSAEHDYVYLILNSVIGQYNFNNTLARS